MSKPIQRRGLTTLIDAKGGAATVPGAGNIYYVIQSSNDDYTRFVRDMMFSYPDGTVSVYGTIQAALDACVAERNDYVYVMPDSADYDLTATLTMSKKAVHLIGPGAMPGIPGATNAARIHQTGAYAAITISGQACEVAGLFIKCKQDKTGIEISAAAHNANIHNNFVALATTDGAATQYGIHATGESQGLAIYENYVTNYSPEGTSKTIGGGIVLDNGTRAIVDKNIVTTGGFGTTMSVGLGLSGAQIIASNNRLVESKSGSPASSTFTLGISAANDTVLFDNRVSMTFGNIANALSGMHSDCAVMNYGSDAAGGDTILS
jgi:hypothetical protein